MKLFDPVPPRTIPPNLVTATAMSFGMVSIYTSLSGGDLQRAAWFVLISVLLDKLDGSVARALKGSTEFGVQMDSFADNVAFGMAPAALIFRAAHDLTPATWGDSALIAGISAPSVLGAICLFYALMTTVRLARFNVMTATLGPEIFLGLPSTLSGGMLTTLFLSIYQVGVDKTWPQVFAFFPLLLLVNAFLMVSNLPLPKAKLSKHKILMPIQATLALVVYVLVLTRTWLWLVLLLVVAYLAVGFLFLGPRMWSASRRD